MKNNKLSIVMMNENENSVTRTYYTTGDFSDHEKWGKMIEEMADLLKESKKPL